VENVIDEETQKLRRKQSQARREGDQGRFAPTFSPINPTISLNEDVGPTASIT
jgi:hypothetical protein